MAASNKDLALAIIQFLNSSISDKSIDEEFSESIDVAIDCIADAFEVNKADAASVLGGRPLLDFVNNASCPASSGSGAATIDEETKAKANAFKTEGNMAMAKKQFELAIDRYSEAISLDPTNVVFLSNRAAAYSSSSQHAKAVEDSKKAIELDPSFSKAYSRLGLAEYALGNAKGAMEAYKRGVEVEGSSPSEAMRRGYETAKKRIEDELESNLSLGDKASLATSEAVGDDDGSSGANADAGASGLPDFSSIFGEGSMPNLSEMMNSPQIMQAAQSLMSNPNAMKDLMNNPMLRSVAQSMGGNAGLAGLMNNPDLQNMASQFMDGMKKSDSTED